MNRTVNNMITLSKVFFTLAGVLLLVVFLCFSVQLEQLLQGGH